MITKFKLFKEGEVSSGNASGKAGIASLPFNKGYYSVGNNGQFGIGLTPTAEKEVSDYKKSIHSKKELLKRKKKEEFHKRVNKKEKDEDEKV